MLAKHLIYFFIGTRVQSRRWLYILSAVLPAFLVVKYAMSVYHVFDWSYSPIVFICILQFFRPTFAGWAAIIIFYSYGLVELLLGLTMEFMDYGSEDHSAWEGWDTALMEVGLAIFIAVFLATVAWNFPKSRVHAT